MTEVVVVIKKTGEVAVEVNGMQGSSCQDITRALSEALGTEVESQAKPEYFVELDNLAVKNFIGS